MPGIHDTAYPRLKSSVSAQELAAVYTPTAEEVTLAHQVAKDTRNRICFLVLLKTFQRLGYFELLHKIPPPIAEHIALLYGVHHGALEWEAYDGSGTRRRHVAFIRDRLCVKPFDDASRKLLAESVRQAARVKEDTADIINVAIEELIRQRYELPGFTTLLVESQRGKAEVNRHFYSGVCRALGAQRCRKIDEMLEADQPNRRSLWQNLKLDAGAPTLTQLRLLAQRLEWLKTLDLTSDDSFAGVPPVKVAHFAREARSLDAGRMLEMEEQKRYTLAAALVGQQRARCLDDLGEMLIKRMRKAHRRAQEAYDEHLLRQQSQTDQLIAVLRQILLAWQTPGSKVERLEAIGRAIGDQAEQLIAECQTRAAYADRNFLPFLWRFCRSSRRLLFAVLEQIELIATGPDGGLERALRFVRKNRACHKEWITLPEAGPPNDAEAFDLSWVPDKWWPLITGRELRHQQAGEVRRRYFELCALTQLAHALQSGDFIIAGSDKFSDYRDQFVSPEEYDAAVGEYCAEVGLPANKPTILDELRRLLEQTARRADAGFPENEHLRIEHGEPVLRRLERRPEPEQLRLIEQLVAETLQPVSILDALADTEHWLNWTKHFGPLSGHEAKLEEPTSGYVATVFSYGCNLGPTQTARALKCADRRRIAWINQRHITEDHLDAAVAQIINAYNRFLLPTMWGTGQRASADGTKWDLYEQNLLSEYHIRYGGYGGIGYYHISDKYIALFSHFIPCGVWEAVYILDGLLQNRSEIQPDTVHADTQGQSAPVFGLAYLLGIKLMPRIRNWKDLKFYRPGKESRYEHIDGLFSEVIDWGLIEENLDDLLRVAVSIRAGRLTASAILRRLGAYSRRNRLYLAFRELGRVVRTEFLLNYIGSLELRHVIQGAINKSESFNKFAQWVSFGGHGLLAENNRDEQRKLIKYNHLVANSLIFYNVYAMTEALHRLRREAVALSKETLQRLSPYLTAHVNRFGDYQLDPNRKPPDLNYDLEIFPSGTST